VAAHENPDVRPHSPQKLDDTGGLERIRDSHERHIGAGRACGFKGFGQNGVPRHAGRAGVRRSRGAILSLVNHAACHPGKAQPGVNSLSHASIPDYNRRAGGRRGVLTRLGMRRQKIRKPEQGRIEEDREKRRRKDQVAPLLGQETERRAEARQDEGELADLRQAAVFSG